MLQVFTTLLDRFCQSIDDTIDVIFSVINATNESQATGLCYGLWDRSCDNSIFKKITRNFSKYVVIVRAG